MPWLLDVVVSNDLHGVKNCGFYLLAEKERKGTKKKISWSYDCIRYDQIKLNL